MTGIYKFTNKYNGKVYIGKSKEIEKRYHKHLHNAKHGCKSLFYTALRKYGSEGFDFDIIMECPIEQLNYWEKFYIRYYCANNKDFGYNMTEGGDGISNPTEEMRKANSKYHKTRTGELNSFYGHHHTETTREALSQISINNWEDKEYRCKQNNKWSKERREEYSNRMSEFRIGQEPWNKGIKTGPNPKLSEAKKGKPTWNKGLKGVQTAWNKGIKTGANPKLSEAKKGKPTWNKGLKGVQTAWNKGIKTGTNPKLSEAKKGKPAWNKGIKTGKPAWNSGKKEEDKIDYIKVLKNHGHKWILPEELDEHILNGWHQKVA